MRAWTVIDCNSQKVPNIVQTLATLGITAESILLEQANDHDFKCQSEAVVISGGARLFTDPAIHQTLLEQFAFIDHLTIPVLGICLGHQAIALRHGADVYLGKERREREMVDLLDKQHPLLADFDSSVNVATDHCEGVTLPENFRLLGRSAHYGVEIMACPADRQFGVQFHPEISGALGDRLFQNFARIASAFHRLPH
ncbi:glutamine amidotransferase-related protein [Kistimonas asteriae]|uniref:glutamine amidotransferase-related protein n=1 Tax=Kistimonas asteriae TaxID=517724 RepID=UPI001BA55A0C|nr:gamma-glutamyl-gamma-aminobutyrate hydrolase family protein [Kistimonas asteriae]